MLRKIRWFFEAKFPNKEIDGRIPMRDVKLVQDTPELIELEWRNFMLDSKEDEEYTTHMLRMMFPFHSSTGLVDNYMELSGVGILTRFDNFTKGQWSCLERRYYKGLHPIAINLGEECYGCVDYELGFTFKFSEVETLFV